MDGASDLTSQLSGLSYDSATAADLSHKSLNELGLAIGQFSHDVGALIADSVGHMVESGTFIHIPNHSPICIAIQVGEWLGI